MKPKVQCRRRIAALVAGLLAAGSSHWQPALAAEIPNIAAAADLQFSLPAIATAFTRQTGKRVKLVFGSSGNFRRQIAEGAPFELFFSADESFVQALAKEGRTEGDGALYAIGRIVLFVPQGSPLKPDAQLHDLADALADGRVKRFAIANPEHAPYGRAAQEALAKAGLWDEIRPRLVLGESVAQAAQFATSGSAQGGIIAYSFALSPALAQSGTYALLPADWHRPLRQRMALIKNAGATARAFYQFLQQPAARAIFRQNGFALPDD